MTVVWESVFVLVFRRIQSVRAPGHALSYLTQVEAG